MLLYIVAFALVRYSVFYRCVRRLQVIIVFVVKWFLRLRENPLCQLRGPENRLYFGKNHLQLFQKLSRN